MDFAGKEGYHMDRIQLFQEYLNEKHNTTITHEHYLNTLREYAPGTDLYMREMHFLLAADPECAVSVSDMAHSLEVTLGAASQMATKLEKKGLITRSPDPADRRRTLVMLTEMGIQLYREHEEYDHQRLKLLSDLFHDFEEKEIVRLIEAEKLFHHALLEQMNRK